MVFIKLTTNRKLKRKLAAAGMALVLVGSASPACIALALAPGQSAALQQAVQESQQQETQDQAAQLSQNTEQENARSEERGKDTGATQNSKATSKERKKSTKGEKAAKLARTYKGCAYAYGASGPNAFDCSGFTRYVYGKLGIGLTHNAQAQYSEGRHVAKSALKAGDLVFFGAGSSGITHVGIYLGKGMFIHAKGSSSGVVAEKLSGRSNYVGACRPY